MFAATLLGPLYAVFVNEIGGSIMTVSVSWAVFIGSTTIFTAVMARFGDAVRYKRNLLAAGYIVRCIGWAGFLFVTNIPGLIAVQVVLGLGEALGSPSFNAIFAEHIDRRKDIKEYSDWDILMNIAIMLGTLAGGYIVTRFGFQYLFVSMAALALIAFFGIMFQPKKIFD